MRLPQHFDGNEWFITVTIVVTTLIVLLLPRRFPAIGSIVLFSLGIGISMYSDFHLCVPPLDLYDINDVQGYELYDLLTFVMYSPFAYLFAYYFDKWSIRGIYVSLYILVWGIGATLFEAWAAYLHVYRYKGWNMSYSFVYYLLAQSVLLLLYHISKRVYNKTKHETQPEWT